MSVEASKETLEFQTEARQILHLMTHSLYSNKEIFLRELVSNASDACDKLRFEALADDSLYDGDSELSIQVDFDEEAKTITISDNGIGMSRQEVIDNVGTIASSGTKKFLEAMSGDQAKDAQMIGQFGVGFYSSFIVADKVTMETRRAGAAADEAVRWESDGEGSFSLENIEKDSRGTKVILHLKEGEAEFASPYRLKAIIKQYSDHISIPVMMTEQEMDEEGNPKKDDDGNVVTNEERVNSASALWARDKADITDEEYGEFYKHVSLDFADPLTWIHSKVEGNQSYTSLLYVPTNPPFDLFDREHKRGVKLYVKRIFIMDDAEHLMPNYLRFIKGVIDSDDLPLNVSREILQQNKVIDRIRGASVKKVLGMLESLKKDDDKEKYETFWKSFGQVLKEGPIEDMANKERIAKLLWFASTHNDSDEQNVTLDEYISRMPEGQDKIYYIIADNYTAAKNSPHLEVFKKKGIEVLLLTDRVDEWLVSHLTEFDGKKLQSVARGTLDIDEEEDKKELEEAEKAYSSVIEHASKVLEGKIKEIRLSQRLTDSPSCLVLEEHDMSPQMQQIMEAAGQYAPKSQPVLELNAEHNLVKKLNDITDDDLFEDYTHLLFEQAQLAAGAPLEDAAGFVKRVNKLLEK
ncbi:MAG: molecular chaperone HtpG [Gammaproteobacteria bacterium]|nr:molecular chaperone HtpG [Gammaproteobacteria bacterium]NNJ51276.1 molecular chaperone HtpG [Gammaproteobacteria bacterium]